VFSIHRNGRPLAAWANIEVQLFADEPFKKAGGSMPNKPTSVPSGLSSDYSYDANKDQVEILWKCLRCGQLMPRGSQPPEVCPSCGAPKTEFVLLDED
jgi:hypothetical protein